MSSESGNTMGPASLGPANSHPIVFFDGVCGLCNGAVDWILARDSRALLRFSPLQSAFAARVLAPNMTTGQTPYQKTHPTPDLNSVVLLKNGRLYRKSAAVLEILKTLGGVWRLLATLARLVPPRALDAVYDWVARHRYRWFGKRETCRLPSPEERARFIECEN